MDGRPIGFPSNNPLTDTRKYQVEYEDGTIEELTTKVITENLFAEYSPVGNEFLFMEEREDYQKKILERTSLQSSKQN